MRKIQTGISNNITGLDVKVYEPVNLYDCTIGNGSIIGPFVEIQKDAIIGSYTTISSHSFICSRVTIGDNCFIGHGVMFTNDLWITGKLSSKETRVLKTIIGNNVLIGSGATLLPVSICDGTVIGAGAVVTRSIYSKGIYAGNPAELLRSL